MNKQLGLILGILTLVALLLVSGTYLLIQTARAASSQPADREAPLVASDVGRNLPSGSPGGPVYLVKDIVPGPNGSGPQDFFSAGEVIFFAANDGVHGWELWISDGSPTGTFMVADINPGGDSVSGHFAEHQGWVYFSADDGVHGYELWQTDGTLTGTRMVKDICPGACPSSPLKPVAMGDHLFFTAYDGGYSNFELWKTDGTFTGTQQVADIRPGEEGSFPRHLTVVGDTLYFQADDGVHNQELWKSDGTSSGTTMVKDICPESCYSGPSLLTVLGGLLYFTATDGSTGMELWKSDGTEAGTVLVKDIRPGVSPSFDTVSSEMVAQGNILYFTADDGTSGREVWVSDGTADGTILIDVRQGGGSNPKHLTPISGHLFFSANNGFSGDKLWKSDGTPAGTVIVPNIVPGLGTGAQPDFLVNANEALLFSAENTAGRELWLSEGELGGMFLVQDLAPGNADSMPRWLTVAGSRVYFRATVDGIGDELWALPVPGDLAAYKMDLSDPSLAGNTIIYTMQISYNNPITVSKVVLTDTLPADVVVLSYPPECSLMSPGLVCPIGLLSPYEQLTRTLEISPTVTGFISNTIEIAGDLFDYRPNNNAWIEWTFIATDQVFLPVILR